MNKYIILVPFILLLTTAGEPSYKAPSGLMVEFIREPGFVKIMDLSPTFSWIVPQKAKNQTACQILVSTSAEKLLKGEGDAWDSGKVPGSNSSPVVYGNGNLKPNSPYFWKVRIWNAGDRPSPWSSVQQFTTGDPKGYQSTPDRFVYSFKEPQGDVTFPDGSRLFDFGKDAFGTLVLRFSPRENDTLIIHLGEKTDKFGKVDRNPGGSVRYQKVLLPVSPGKKEYILNLPPDVRNSGPAAIHINDTIGVITPFRYAEFESFPSDLLPKEILQRVVTSYFDDSSSSFTSSDSTLNSVWDICKYSMKATSFAGVYVDGDRERIPYEADAYINQLGHYYTDRAYSMGRATSEYFINHPTWPTEWILHTVPLFYNDFMFTGDIESVKVYYNELKKKTLFMLDRGDGLISSKNANDEIMKSLGFSNSKERIRDIVDWPPAQKDTGWKLAGPDGERDGYDMREINSVVNAFYYNGLVLMSKLSGYAGNKADSAWFRKCADKTYASFNEKLFDVSKGIYTDGEGSAHSSLHANMTALAFGLVPTEHVKTVVDFIRSRGMACSVYGAQYLLQALYLAGEDQYALSLLTDKSDRSWYNMIRSGSTITMEAWDMKYKPNSDWNHAWGAAPANIIPGFLWGISASEPGFAKVVIKPLMGNLKYSTIKVPTIRGTIGAEYKNNGKTKLYQISIPGNMECDLVLADSKIYKLYPGKNKIVLVYE